MVSFSSIPQSLRTPLFFAELDNSKANTGSETQRTLIVAPKMTAGTMASNVPVLLQGVTWAKTAAGQGSQLALMAEWYRKRDSFGEVYLLPIDDPSAGAAATGTITVASAPTATGTLSLYVAGYLVQVAASSSLTTATMAAAIAAAINAKPDLPVTATSSAAVVTLTSKNKGDGGNKIDVRANFYGAAGGEVMPTGLALTIVGMAGGSGAPALDAALANLGDKTFDFIVSAYTDSTSLTALKTLLAARWAWDKMLYGHVFAGLKGTLADATTAGNGLNDPHLTIMPANASPTPPWLWAANMAGQFASSLRADPGLPLHGLPLDVLAPAPEYRFTITERNTLLYDGMSTFTVADDGTVTTETIITTYQTNALGVADDSYLYVERLYTLAFIIRYLKARVTSTFGRFKLTSEGTTANAGTKVVTPSSIRVAILGWYRELVAQGIAQEYETFRDNLVVERNASNKCRVDALLPVVPIDQLRQICGVVQFRNAGETV